VASGETYAAVLRPGEPNQQSVDGLDSDSLDRWIGTHGQVGDRFTYRSMSSDGEVLVRGDGIVDEQGDAAYRLRS
jgi:hypothetical protein